MGSMSSSVHPHHHGAPAAPPEEVGSDAEIRGHKRKQEEERFVGEGSGKNNDFNFTEYLNDSDMEADGEQLDDDGSEEGEVRKKGKGMVKAGKKDEGQRKETKQE